jgi:hypothetical protein
MNDAWVIAMASSAPSVPCHTLCDAPLPPEHHPSPGTKENEKHHQKTKTQTMLSKNFIQIE